MGCLMVNYNIKERFGAYVTIASLWCRIEIIGVDIIVILTR